MLSRNRRESRRANGSDRSGNAQRVHRIFADAARLHQAGRVQDAVARYEQAILLKPDLADIHNNLGVALGQLGQVDNARARFEHALSLNPDHANAHNNLGNLFVSIGRVDEAVIHLERACDLNPSLIGAHKSLGAAYTRQGRLDHAVRCYQRGLVVKPDDPEIHNELATLFKFRGRFDDAAAHYERAIAIHPFCAEAHYNRAEIKRFYPGDPDLRALEALAQNDELPARKAVFVHFALAKALEDCGEFGRAFEHLRKGNDLKRRQIAYNEPDVDRYFERISAVFDRRVADRLRGEGDASSMPIFVLGMPRSGSTLVEQILSSHPAIYGAGELTDLDVAIRTVLHSAGRSLQYPECMPDLDGVILREIGQAYVTRLRDRVVGDAVRVVDKSLSNFLHLGLIHLALPNAKIIHIRRNPVDTCLSCYSKLFTTGQQFSYNLAELGRFFRRYAKLMAHWRSILPAGTILEVAYEDLVDDPEGQARRMIGHCGLHWDDGCLSFYQNGRPVLTASAVQVRTPVFRSSLQRWRKYEGFLAPLLDELREVLPAKALAAAK